MDLYKYKCNIFELSKYILNIEGLNDWKIVWWTAPPSECHEKQKEIWISESYNGHPIYYQFEILMHELAHIGNPKHNYFFYHRLSKLFMKYSLLWQ